MMLYGAGLSYNWRLQHRRQTLDILRLSARRIVCEMHIFTASYECDMHLDWHELGWNFGCPGDVKQCQCAIEGIAEVKANIQKKPSKLLRTRQIQLHELGDSLGTAKPESGIPDQVHMRICTTETAMVLSSVSSG